MIEAKPALRCLRCLYGDQHGYCSYILVMQHRRPCPPGADCTVFEPHTGKRKPEPIAIIPPATKHPKPTRPRGKQWDKVKARALYDAGRTDRDIAETLGVRVGTISAWRSRVGLPSKHRGGVRT